MNKKLIALLGVAALATGAFAAPHRGFGPRPMMHRAPMHHHVDYHHHHHHGHSGFWGGVVGGVVGGLAYSAFSDPVVVSRSTTYVTTPTVVTQPVVVQQPVVTQPVVVQQPVVQPVVQQPVTTVQNVWVEGRYVDQVQANGTVVRVWQPGHYEQRSVVVQ